ncbi:MAG: methionine--tRNA ligase [bacterium]|nr:methionine--tRNA ligase [bacterium]
MTADRKQFYLTTAIPYVNARPHIGHALEFIQADVIARFERSRGRETLLLSGSDEDALKNVQAADAAGRPVQEFVDANAELFVGLALKLGVAFDAFQKGSDRERHFPSSQELWRRCAAAGDIYRKAYRGLYCVGCEAFYEPEELTVEGECHEHPGRTLEVVEEENYFFRLSRYQEQIRDLIVSGRLAIIPETRKNEVLVFLERPLEDISISRTNERARNWGVPVPGDDSQRIYVWFDALNIYQSGVGFGWDEARYKKWWPADVHLIGKGIIRFHAVYWPAFLLSAGLDVPKSIAVHGYLTVDGRKMSKSLGNVVDPFDLITRYGAETLRYFLLREVPFGEDGDFSEEKLRAVYNGELANGLGNLVARVSTLGARVSPLAFDAMRDAEPEVRAAVAEVSRRVTEDTERLKLHEALAAVWRAIAFTDRYLSKTKPWEIEDRSELGRTIGNAAYLVTTVGALLEPFLPETAERIGEQVRYRGGAFEIKRGAVLFPRLAGGE